MVKAQKARLLAVRLPRMQLLQDPAEDLPCLEILKKQEARIFGIEAQNPFQNISKVLQGESKEFDSPFHPLKRKSGTKNEEKGGGAI